VLRDDGAELAPKLGVELPLEQLNLAVTEHDPRDPSDAKL
jgi:hypothetical protein